jgi:hypothetical protein
MLLFSWTAVPQQALLPTPVFWGTKRIRIISGRQAATKRNLPFLVFAAFNKNHRMAASSRDDLDAELAQLLVFVNPVENFCDTHRTNLALGQLFCPVAAIPSSAKPRFYARPRVPAIIFASMSHFCRENSFRSGNPGKSYGPELCKPALPDGDFDETARKKLQINRPIPTVPNG